MIQILITPAQSNIENHSNNEMSLATTKIGLCTQTPTRNGGGAGIWCASRCWPWHRRRRRAADAAPHPAPDTDAPQPTPRPPLAPRPPFAFRPAARSAGRGGPGRRAGAGQAAADRADSCCCGVSASPSCRKVHVSSHTPRLVLQTPGASLSPPISVSSCPGPVWVAFYQEIQLLDKEL